MRIRAGFFGEADLGEQRKTLRTRFGDRLAQHVDRCFDDIAKRGEMGEQVEGLEHHADLGTNGFDTAIGVDDQLAIDLIAINWLAIEMDGSVVDRLEMIDAAE